MSLNPVVAVPLKFQPRCFFCGSFLPLNPSNPRNHRCATCGVVHDLSPEPLLPPQTSVTVSALSPNGKLFRKKIIVRPESGQLSLFGGAQ